MADSESFWHELSTTALLGTLRRPFRSELREGSLGNLLAPLPDPLTGGARPGEDGERVLLRAITAAALHQRAGQLPPTTGRLARLATCPTSDLPRCSRRAGACLERILSGGNTTLLREWTQLAAVKGQRIREEQLALVLQKQQAAATFRTELLLVLGERGRWLAAHNPDWHAFHWHLDEAAWHEGGKKERLAFLNDQRASDPQLARALLESTWEQESPADRTIFLEVLGSGLSMADEPFLESALDDRASSARHSAAGLLERLPQSRLVERMMGRARRLLAWKPGLLRSTLEVRLPEAYTDDMRRDGITPEPPANIAMPQNAWWLAQILAAVPPASWTRTWKRRPLTFLEMVGKHGQREALLYGLTEASVRHADAAWLEALFHYESQRDDPRRLFDLFSRLPDAMQDRLMFGMLRGDPSLSYDQPASIWLSACRFAWSKQLTQAVMHLICQTLQKGDFQPWRWEILLREIGAYFHPDLLEQSAAQLADAQQKLTKQDPYVRDLLAILHFRLEMQRAFA